MNIHESKVNFFFHPLDDDTQQDMFYDQSDEEKEDEEGEEAKWRKDRFEREKWLQEQQMVSIRDYPRI